MGERYRDHFAGTRHRRRSLARAHRRYRCDGGRSAARLALMGGSTARHADRTDAALRQRSAQGSRRPGEHDRARNRKTLVGSDGRSRCGDRPRRDRGARLCRALRPAQAGQWPARLGRGASQAARGDGGDQPLPPASAGPDRQHPGRVDRGQLRGAVSQRTGARHRRNAGGVLSPRRDGPCGDPVAGRQVAAWYRPCPAPRHRRRIIQRVAVGRNRDQSPVGSVAGQDSRAGDGRQ